MHNKLAFTETTKNFPIQRPQKISQTFIMQTFPAQITETTKISFTRKPYNNFLHTENFQFIPPFRCYTQQKQQKTHIVPNQKSRTQPKKKKKAIQMLFQYKCFFNFAQNNIGTTTFFTTKLTPNPEKLSQNNN